MTERVAERLRLATGLQGLAGAWTGVVGNGWVGRFFCGGGCERNGYAGAAGAMFATEEDWAGAVDMNKAEKMR